jgi:transposase
MAAFDIKILPWFDMSKSNKVSKTNRRKLGYLAHGKFRQRLILRCGGASNPNNRIIWLTEEFTSKLCSNCHAYCGYLGGSRTFKCPRQSCGQWLERDGNAARNIWLWAIMQALEGLMNRTGAAAGKTQEPKAADTANITELLCNPPAGFEALLALGCGSTL